MAEKPELSRARGRSRGRTRGPPVQELQQMSLSGAPAPPPSRPPYSAPSPGTSTAPYPTSAPRPVSAPQPSSSAPRPPPQGTASRTVPGPSGVSSIPEESSRPKPRKRVEGAGGGDAGNMKGPRGRRFREEYAPRIVTRPANLVSKQGVTGRKVKLTANYYELIKHTDWALYQYRVDFAPDDERTSVRKNLLKDHKEFLGPYIFDGTVLFISHRLNPVPMELFSMADDRSKVRITLKLAGDLVMGDHHYLQFFNIIMRKCLASLQLQLVGRNYFDAEAKVAIPEYKLELWPGYVTSIRQHESSILMCAEISHKVMRRETALDLILESSTRAPHNWREVFQSAVIGNVVLTGYNNKTYRIDDIDFDAHPLSTFKLKDGSSLSYYDYYKNRYNIIIEEMKQPLLVSRAKPRDIRAGMTGTIYLVPELCRLTGLTDEMRANFQLMRALADHTRVVPETRIEKLKNFSTRLSRVRSIQEEMRLWNIRLSSDLVTFEGRVLDNEYISFGNKKLERAEDADWTRIMRGQAMLNNVVLKDWAIIYLTKAQPDIVSFIATLIKSSASLRFNLPQPLMRGVRDDRCVTYVEGLEVLISTRSPQLIMCVVPNNRSDRYSAIKKKCCVDRAVPTQVVVAKNLKGKGLMSIATKIAIQLNCKIGGTPWGVQIPMQHTSLMVVGYDVCHDTSNKGRSFGAMVASLNNTLSRYFSAATAHTSGEELSNDLSMNIIKAVVKYRAVNAVLPGMIIIYRDGVGEGQIPFVYNHEVTLIKERLYEIYGATLPRFAFIIVTKRLNTRIFLNNKNPPPGTIADTCITCPEKYDFFLISQSVRQGTVSPTAYNVIEDTSSLDPDKMQRLTYKMTHLYYNWSGTVRVPAQCQYAHKLAFLVGQSLHRSPNNQLSDLLYFL